MAQVAAAAGVSRTTVSLVLNGQADRVGIAVATRERILQAAERLGCHKGTLGRQVAAARDPFLLLWADSLASEADARVVAAVVDEAQAVGQPLRVVHGAAGRRALEAAPSGVLGWALAPADRGLLNEWQAREGLPVALIADACGVDELRPAIAHLLELGHRRLGLLASPAHPELESGFAHGVADAWLPFGEEAVLRPEAPTSLARDEVRDWLKPRKSRPTAVLCTSDAAALLAIRVGRRLELKIPRELSVIGYGDSALSAVAEPALTTIASPLAERARAAVRQVLGLAWEPPGEPRLVLRKSTAAPAG